MNTPRRPLLPIAILALSAVACSTDDDGGERLDLRETEPVMRQRAGSLVLEYNPGLSNGVSVHAQFLEVEGVSLGAALDALDAWTPDRALEPDACSVRQPQMPAEQTSPRVRMLDAGPISVAALDHAIELAGRRVPDLQSLSGVVYGNEEGFDFDEAFLPYEPLARYTIMAPGAEVAGFGLALQAPPQPHIEAISGQYVVDSAPILLGGDDLSLQWSAEPQAPTALYLDVVGSQLRMQCHLADDGRFVVPASVLEQFDHTRPLVLTLRRVDAVELPLEGVETGSFVFAAAEEVQIIP